MAKRVKHLLAMQETRVQPLDRIRPLFTLKVCALGQDKMKMQLSSEFLNFEVEITDCQQTTTS